MRRTISAAFGICAAAWIFPAAGAAVAGEAGAAETAEFASPWKFSGTLDVVLASAYLSSGGTLADTRPVSTQLLDLKLDSGRFGYLTGYAWFTSSLHDMQRDRHRMLFNEFEGAVKYGYAWEPAEGWTLDSRAGPLWNPPFGYKHSNQNYWGPAASQSLANPYLTPYWSGLWLLAPEMRGRVKFGAERAFALLENLKIALFAETVWMDRRRFGAKYGGDPENDHMFGGAFATMQTGFKLTWTISPEWRAFLMFRQFDLINAQARRAVKRSDDYWAKCDWPVARLGVTYCF